MIRQFQQQKTTMNILTVNDVRESFHYQSTDFQINREYPTKSQMQEVRRKIMKNLTKLPCIETDFDNFKWAILLVKPKYLQIAEGSRSTLNV